MLYKNILAAPDHAPFVREVREAMPFVVDNTAMGMAAELVSSTDRSEFAETFKGFRLPHHSVWLEHKTDDAFMRVADKITEGRYGSLNARFQVIAYLFTSEPDHLIRVRPFTADQDGDIAEPFVTLQFSTLTGATQIRAETDIYQEKMRKIYRAGVHPADVKAFMDSHAAYLMDCAVVGGVIGSRLFALMSAKDSPLDQVATGPMTRQERRHLARKGGSVTRDVTRIILNEEGRNHMCAVAQAGDPGAARKAHWVRGHLMRTESKGYVWRRSHVRGLGDPLMRPRAVSAVPENPEEMPSP